MTSSAASCQRGAYTITFTDDRDFCDAVSKLLGVSYTDPAEAAEAINGLRALQCFGHTHAAPGLTARTDAPQEQRLPRCPTRSEEESFEQACVAVIAGSTSL